MVLVIQENHSKHEKGQQYHQPDYHAFEMFDGDDFAVFTDKKDTPLFSVVCRTAGSRWFHIDIESISFSDSQAHGARC